MKPDRSPRPSDRMRGSVLIMALVISAIVGLLATLLITQTHSTIASTEWQNNRFTMILAANDVMPWATVQSHRLAQASRPPEVDAPPLVMPTFTDDRTGLTREATLATLAQQPNAALQYCLPAHVSLRDIPLTIQRHTYLLHIVIHKNKQHFELWRCLAESTQGISIIRQNTPFACLPNP